MEKKHNFVYRLEFKKNPRYYYIGKHSTNLEPEKDPYLGSGSEVRRYKQIHGKDCFTRIILCDFQTKKEALEKEAEILGDSWKLDPFCLNIIAGGANSGKFDNTGLIHIHKDGLFRNIEPERLKLFEQEGWKKGQPKSEQAKESIKRAVTELWKDPDYREHQRLAHLGNKSHLGHKVSEEGRKRMSESGKRPKPWLRGRTISEQQRKASQIRNSQFRWISKDSEVKKIHESELSVYLQKGWIRGRKGYSRWKTVTN